MTQTATPPVDQARVEDRVSKAKSLLILDHPFFGTAVSRRPIIYTDTVPTAAMAGTGQMYINPAFVEPLTVKQIMFLLAHEALHYMLGHSFRLKHRDPKAWNVACDKVINDTLVDAKVGDMIEGGIYMRDARNYAAEELYDENEDGGGQGAGGTGNDVGPPVDGNGKPMDDSQIAEAQAQAKIEAIQSAKAAKAVGKLPGGIERLVDQLVHVTTPWHEIFERRMTAKVRDGMTWSKPSRRFIAKKMYLPGPDTKPKMGTVVIAVDMSGSIGQDELNLFNAHGSRIVETCKPAKVIVVYCDSSVSHVDEFGPDDYPITLKAHGGGGTAFKPVFEYLDEHEIESEAVVYLTDGHGDQKSFTSERDTIWLTTHSTDFDWGEVIKYEE